MSFKKKKPGNKWVTGKQRAELQKMKLWLVSQMKANAAQPIGAQPISELGLATYNAFQAEVLLLLSLIS